MSKCCISNEKTSYCYTFYNKNHSIYLYITCNKKILFVKNIVAYCEYSPTSPFFLLLSEHKNCDNAATNSNSENARSRMAASLRGSVATGTKEDESKLTFRREWIVIYSYNKSERDVLFLRFI